VDADAVVGRGTELAAIEAAFARVADGPAGVVLTGDAGHRARSMTASGSPVTHVISILMPVDEVVFTLIRAGDEQLVHELGLRAGLPADRIATAITLNPGPVPEPAGGPTS
jgi:hypothetical protein